MIPSPAKFPGNSLEDRKSTSPSAIALKTLSNRNRFQLPTEHVVPRGVSASPRRSSGGKLNVKSAQNELDIPLLEPSPVSPNHVVDILEASAEKPRLEGEGSSAISAIINLVNTTVGSGILAIPAALSSCGLIPGLLFIFFSASCSLLGLFFLTESANLANLDKGASFFSLAQATYPRAAIYFDAAIVVKCMGVAVSYLIIAHDLLPEVSSAVGFISGNLLGMSPQTFWTLVTLIVVIPTCSLRKLDSLKYTSILALASICYLILLVSTTFFREIHTEDSSIPWDQVDLWVGRSGRSMFTSLDALKTLPMIIFAFTCHQNVCAIYNELADNSRRTMAIVTVSSTVIAALAYVVVGILGYLTFGRNVSANLVAMYPAGPQVTLAQFAIAILVIFSVALQVHPCRLSLDRVIGGEGIRRSIPRRRFIILTTIILFVVYTLALGVKNLGVILAIVGATGSTAIQYILPGLFYWKLSTKKGILREEKIEIGNRWWGLSLAVYGGFIMIFSLTARFLL